MILFGLSRRAASSADRLDGRALYSSSAGHLDGPALKYQNCNHGLRAGILSVEAGSSLNWSLIGLTERKIQPGRDNTIERLAGRLERLSANGMVRPCSCPASG